MVVITIKENAPEIEEKKVRKYFDEKSQKWQFSVVDVIGLTTSSSDPRNYWKVLKNRLKKSQNKLVTDCNQLKMKANDGKFYLTDVAEPETLLSLLYIVPNANIQAFNALLLHNSAKIPEMKKPLEPLDEIQEVANSRHDEGEAELLVDAYQTASEIFIIVMVAGVDENSLQINLGNKKIIISGKRIRSTPSNSPEGREKSSSTLGRSGEVENYLIQELVWTTFSRTISLPAPVEPDKIEKVLENGKLVIRLIKNSPPTS